MSILGEEANAGALMLLLLNQTWHVRCKVIRNYMPPFPKPDTRPILVVQCDERFLRYSRGPIQGYFWDSYGEDFKSVEWAIIALSRAPYPGRIPFPEPEEATAVEETRNCEED